VPEWWRLEVERGPAADLHRRSAELAAGVDGRLVRVLDAAAPALVLGSGQPIGDVDSDAASRAGVAVVRRRSGGAAVLVGPGEVLWVDLIIPAGDPLWDHDVGRAAWWVGEAWASALESAGVAPTGVWKGAMRVSRWSRQVCFAGLGPGEVTAGGRKVVGVSQRRTRGAALFQTAALLRWDPARTVELLKLEPAEAAAAMASLSTAARGLGGEQAGAVLRGLQDALAEHGPVAGA
jgi:lipoate---protein ligase